MKNFRWSFAFFAQKYYLGKNFDTLAKTRENYGIIVKTIWYNSKKNCTIVKNFRTLIHYCNYMYMIILCWLIKFR